MDIYSLSEEELRLKLAELDDTVTSLDNRIAEAGEAEDYELAEKLEQERLRATTLRTQIDHRLHGDAAAAVEPEPAAAAVVAAAIEDIVGADDSNDEEEDNSTPADDSANNDAIADVNTIDNTNDEAVAPVVEEVVQSLTPEEYTAEVASLENQIEEAVEAEYVLLQ